MGDSTRGSGPDDEAKIISMSDRKAKKESAEIHEGAGPHGVNTPDAGSDLITPDRARTGGRAMNVIRMRPNRSNISMARTGPKKTSLSDTIKKNKQRAKYLSESRTARIDGLHPIQNAPIKSISGGVITEEQPQVLADRDSHIKQRGQVKLYSVYLLNKDSIEDRDERISGDDAINELLAIASILRDADFDRNHSSDTKEDIFDEVALILLKLTGGNFNGLLNDQRVESVCLMLRRNDTKAKLRHQLGFILTHPV